MVGSRNIKNKNRLALSAQQLKIVKENKQRSRILLQHPQ